MAYGTEAMGVMRIEKGHVASDEINGRMTAVDLGLGRVVAQGEDCIGVVMVASSGPNRPCPTEVDRAAAGESGRPAGSARISSSSGHPPASPTTKASCPPSRSPRPSEAGSGRASWRAGRSGSASRCAPSIPSAARMWWRRYAVPC